MFKEKLGKLAVIALMIILFSTIPLVYYVYSLLTSVVGKGSFLEALLVAILYIYSALFIVIEGLLFTKLLDWNDKKENKFNKKDYITSLKDHLFNDNEKANDIHNLMIDNMAEIREYFIISKSQAKKSFLFAVILAFLGLILFMGAAYIGFSMGEIQPAILAAIGGVITEIVSIFALYIYKGSQEQLNRYYQALHYNEQYLSTVHLVNKLAQDRQCDAYEEIIRSTLQNLKNCK